jgi:tRNA G18 (ribose-2'-O)-methylase SpoU
MDTIADTSRAPAHLPLYHWPSLAELRLPRGCRLVGVEILEEAVDLPAFAHPLQAAYVLGRERGSLSPELVARCHHIIRIPTAFSLNLATAGAIVMYDRLRCSGRYAARPVAEGGTGEPRRPHVQGAPRKRRRS